MELHPVLVQNEEPDLIIPLPFAANDDQQEHDNVENMDEGGINSTVLDSSPFAGYGDEENLGMNAMMNNLQQPHQPVINSSSSSLYDAQPSEYLDAAPAPNDATIPPRPTNVQPIFIIDPYNPPVEEKGLQTIQCPYHLVRFTTRNSAIRHFIDTGCFQFEQIDPVPIRPRNHRRRADFMNSAKLSEDDKVLKCNLGKALVDDRHFFEGVVDSVKNVCTSVNVLNKLSQRYGLPRRANWRGVFLCWATRTIGEDPSQCGCGGGPGIHLHIRKSATQTATWFSR